jgi:fatty-acyl-CoA synthase
MLRGLMMDEPLLISSILKHASQNHADTEIVSRTVEGPIHRYTYADCALRARKLAQALSRLGVREGERIGTLAWNGYRHLELYYAVSGMGAVIHTINPRLFLEQIVYIIGHAEDQYICFDINLLPLVEKLAPQCPAVRGWIAMTDAAHQPQTTLKNLLVLDPLIEAESGDYSWPRLDELTASGLCYTSGTTGNPKGVLYHHRSTLLLSLSASATDAIGLSARDVVMPAVPMFHVNAWAIPYMAPMNGAKLVMPGSRLDAESLYELLESEKVTVTAGVPTVWLSLLDYLKKNGRRLSTLKRVVVGGSACPPAMIKEFEHYGVLAQHAWGMTEMSPLGSFNALKPRHLAMSTEDRFKAQQNQGRALFGIEMKITDGAQKDLPQDGKAFGDLLVHGLWVTKGYFKDEASTPIRDGWFVTGDVATIDPDGFMTITDRSKDVIKSGGEWISSIDLENIAIAHPEISEAAVIGANHPKWGERPLLIAVKKQGATVTAEALLSFYKEKVAPWWIPDEVVFVTELPHTATGKLLKTKLREIYRTHLWTSSTS